jgi:hypothetical protein
MLVIRISGLLAPASTLIDIVQCSAQAAAYARCCCQRFLVPALLGDASSPARWHTVCRAHDASF